MGLRAGGGGQTTLRGMATGGGQAPAGQQPNPAAAAGGEVDDVGGEGDDFDPKTFDPRRSFNETRKLQRLLKKKDEELATLRGEFEPIKKKMSKFDAFERAFSGQDEGADEGDEPLSAYDQASRAHQRMIDLDPESPGMPLTVTTAREATEALKIARQIQEENKRLTEKLSMYEKPMYIAEQSMFVNLDGLMRDQVQDLFEDEALANENFEDFERVAIDRLKKLKQTDPSKYRRLVRSSAQQEAFIREVVAAKIPRAFTKRGASPVQDEYSSEQAQHDMHRAMGMKPGPERAALLKKARQRLLPEMLGVDIPRQR